MPAPPNPVPNRPRSEVDEIAERWVDELAALVPTLATYIGRDEHDTELPDYSPAGLAAQRDAAERVLRDVLAAAPADETDRVTVADFVAELRLSIEQQDANEPLRDLNVLASPAQDIRDVFDLMPTADETDWERIEQRMRRVAGALAGYRASLVEGARLGIAPALRQVREVAAQAHRTAGDAENTGFFVNLAAEARVSEPLRSALAAAAQDASAAYGDFAVFLMDDLSRFAAEEDAFGRERYERASESFLGMRVDLDEAYEWGIDELARMRAEQERVAAEIVGGPPRPSAVSEAIAMLDSEADRKLHGVDELRRWMQDTSDRAVRELGETQFEIPEEIRTLECMIAPTQEGGIYYTGPSDDFSRPGRMWWSVPEGVTEFDTWRERTTVYHEGVPGHHLQIGQAVVNRGMLNEWRRQLAGTSGHAEGWALYAERLMEELGYLDDPADRLGMLDGQRMRAARVVLDIGVHLGKEPPGGGTWSAEVALAFMREHCSMDDSFIRFEVNRYLGWAGQAPSYKIGQRVWEELRSEAMQRSGGEHRFDVRAFHRDALALGGVRLDTLQRALRGEFRNG